MEQSTQSSPSFEPKADRRIQTKKAIGLQVRTSQYVGSIGKAFRIALTLAQSSDVLLLLTSLLGIDNEIATTTNAST
jgi:hypothetical protein